MLADYVLFPLQMTVEMRPQTGGEWTATRAMECLQQLLERCADMLRPSTWMRLLTWLAGLLTPAVPYSLRPSPDLTNVTIACFSALCSRPVQRAEDDPLRRSLGLELGALRLRPRLGHAIYVLLDAAEHAPLGERASRASAMRAAADLVALVVDEPRGLVSASFLPGIVSSVARVVTTSGDRQGYAVLSAALSTWSRTIALALNDDLLMCATHAFAPRTLLVSPEAAASDAPCGRDAGCDAAHALAIPPTAPATASVSDAGLQRDANWLADTRAKLATLGSRILAVVQAHSAWQVRLAAVAAADQLLRECRFSLAPLTPQLVELLVAGFGDEYAQVRTASAVALAALFERQSRQQDDVDDCGIGHPALTLELTRRFMYHVTSLPRLVRSSQAHALHALRLCVSFAKLLCADLKSLCCSPPHLRRLVRALYAVFEMDTSDVTLLEDRGPVNFDAPTLCAATDVQPYRRRFVHFTDSHILDVATELCELLGCFGDVHALADALIHVAFPTGAVGSDAVATEKPGTASAAHPYQKQALLILSHILHGAAAYGVTATALPVPPEPESSATLPTASLSSLSSVPFSFPPQQQHQQQRQNREHLGALVSLLLLPLYTAPENWQLYQHHGRTDAADEAAALTHDRVMTTCLLLEGIGVLARTCSTTHADQIVLHALYGVLAMACSANAVISRTAQGVLETMAAHCAGAGRVSIETLVLRNLDYLVDAVARDLRHLDSDSLAPLVLDALLRYSRPDAVVPLVEGKSVACPRSGHHAEDRRRCARSLRRGTRPRWQMCCTTCSRQSIRIASRTTRCF